MGFFDLFRRKKTVTRPVESTRDEVKAELKQAAVDGVENLTAVVEFLNRRSADQEARARADSYHPSNEITPPPAPPVARPTARPPAVKPRPRPSSSSRSSSSYDPTPSIVAASIASSSYSSSYDSGSSSSSCDSGGGGF